MERKVVKILVIYDDGTMEEFSPGSTIKTPTKPKKVYTEEGLKYIYPDGREELVWKRDSEPDPSVGREVP